MSYKPSNIPSDPKALPLFLEQEHRNIAHSIAQSEQMLALQPQYTKPKRYTDGCVCFADGVNWNPGAGKGLYVFHSSVWNKLG